MAVYVITGKLGSGKTVCGVSRALEYLREGRPVATNIDLQPEAVLPSRARYVVTRLPDFPTADDFWALGVGNPTLDETKNGLILLDECGLLFNSRDWDKTGKSGINNWFRMSRKLGWDVALIIQSFGSLDKQIREEIGEHVVLCRRLDRIKVLGVSLPRVFIAIVRYGAGPTSPTIDRWITRGSNVFGAFATRQIFKSGEDVPGQHCLLSAWHLRGRHLTEWQLMKAKFWALVMVFGMVGFGGGIGADRAYQGMKAGALPERKEIAGYVLQPGGVSVSLTSGEVFAATGYQLTRDGLVVERKGIRYVESDKPGSAPGLGKF